MQGEIQQENISKNSMNGLDRKTFSLPRENFDTLEFVKFTDQLIRKIAQQRLKNNNIAKLFFVQTCSEWRLLLLKQVNFRRRQNKKACKAYCEMTIGEFELINARQQWANWRTIPRNLSGCLPNHPIRAIDLCCGTGQSTEVLSCYLPLGSKILGLEFNPEFVKKAQSKTYLHRTGKLSSVAFRAQSVLEPFHDDRGNLIDDGSIDLVNSSGAVGSHFDIQATQNLAHEIARVTRLGGLATIDCGLPGTDKNQVTKIFKNSGFIMLHSAKSCFFEPFSQVCFQRV